MESVYGLLAAGVGVILLLYSLCRPPKSRHQQRRKHCCGLGGGCLFVLGVTFASLPQPWGGAVLLVWGFATASVLLFQELLAPR